MRGNVEPYQGGWAFVVTMCGARFVFPLSFGPVLPFWVPGPVSYSESVLPLHEPQPGFAQLGFGTQRAVVWQGDHPRGWIDPAAPAERSL